MRPLTDDSHLRYVTTSTTSGEKTVKISYLWRHLLPDVHILAFASIIEMIGYILRLPIIIMYLICDFGMNSYDANTYFTVHKAMCIAFSIVFNTIFNDASPVVLLSVSSLIECIGALLLVVTDSDTVVGIALFIMIPIGVALGAPVSSKLIKQYVFPPAISKVNVFIYFLCNVGATVAFVGSDYLQLTSIIYKWPIRSYRLIFLCSALFELLYALIIGFGGIRGNIFVDATGIVWDTAAPPTNERIPTMYERLGNMFFGYQCRRAISNRIQRAYRSHLTSDERITLQPDANREIQYLAPNQRGDSDNLNHGTYLDETEPSNSGTIGGRHSLHQNTNGICHTIIAAKLGTAMAGVVATMKSLVFWKLVAIMTIISLGTGTVHRYAETVLPEVSTLYLSTSVKQSEIARGCIAPRDPPVLDINTSGTPSANVGAPTLNEISNNDIKDSHVPWNALMAIDPITVMIFTYPVNHLLELYVPIVWRFFLGGVVTTLALVPMIVSMNYYTIAAFMFGVSFAEVVWSPTLVTFATKVAPYQYISIWMSIAAMPRVVASTFSGVTGGMIVEWFCPAAEYCIPFNVWSSALIISFITPIGILVVYCLGWTTSMEQSADDVTFGIMAQCGGIASARQTDLLSCDDDMDLITSEIADPARWTDPIEAGAWEMLEFEFNKPRTGTAIATDVNANANITANITAPIPNSNQVPYVYTGIGSVKVFSVADGNKDVFTRESFNGRMLAAKNHAAFRHLPDAYTDSITHPHESTDIPVDASVRHPGFSTPPVHPAEKNPYSFHLEYTEQP